MKDIVQNIQQLINEQQSLFLSTLDLKGNPAASYAPYFCDEKENAFYIFISDLSEHTQHLKQNSTASVLIAKDEQDTQQIFARNRVTYSVNAEIIDREFEGKEAEHRQQILEKMQQQFGDIIELLSGLSDFHLFKLQADQGRYIEGFGKAFDIGKGVTGGIRTVTSQK